MNRLTDREMACIRKLAEIFSQGTTQVSFAANTLALNESHLDQPEFSSMFQMMEGLKAIENVRRFADGTIDFTITVLAVQMARELEELEKQSKVVNLVEQIKEKAQANPIIAWIIIGFTVYAILAAGISQTIQIVKSFSAGEKQPAIIIQPPTVNITIPKDAIRVEIAGKNDEND